MGNSSKTGRFWTGSITALAAILAIAGCASREFTLPDARVAAAKGDAKAEYFLAIQYAKGHGVPQDNAKAAEYMRQSAESGYAFAQNDLGVYYLSGRGVMTNTTEAAKWIRKAAEQGDPLGEYSLGLLYSQGTGVPLDLLEAVTWYRKAAEQNQLDAAAALGNIYLFGAGHVTKNNQEAFKWYRKGAKKNNAICLNGLGFLYQKGWGTPKNPSRCIECYREAAGNGYIRAYANLGELYVDGVLVKVDLVEAYKWFTLGADAGDGVAKHYLNEAGLQRILSDSQKAEAYRRIQEYKTQQKKTRPGMTRKYSETKCIGG